MENEEKPNTFAAMEKKAANSEAPVQKVEAVKQKTEIDVNDFSDTAVGDKVKYVRPALDGQEDVVDRFVVEPADTSRGQS